MCIHITHNEIGILERESVFRQRYAEGMRKEQYWEPALEDSLQLIAKLPALAAGVYRIRFGKGEPLTDPDPAHDWAQSYPVVSEN